jgi:ClpP class serine protease
MNESDNTQDQDRTDQNGVMDNAVPEPTKTPFFQAIHALRYQRQGIIKNLEEKTKRCLICYVAGVQAPIDRDDTVGFVDLLHNVGDGQDLDLLLHTPGGDIDAAEKLISMVRNKVGTAQLRVIVPDFAKSAGTLMVLGADCVVMSDTSELGPIDPQIIRGDGRGNLMQHPVQSYLDAYEEHSKTLKKDPSNVAAQVMLSKLDPETVKLFESVRARARKFAEDQLKRGMFRGNAGNWSQAASALIDTKRWQSHGQMISWEDAQDAEIGLTVQYLSPSSDEWQMFWQLYCLQRLAIADRQKLFESNYVSIVIDSTVTHEAQAD